MKLRHQSIKKGMSKKDFEGIETITNPGANMARLLKKEHVQDISHRYTEIHTVSGAVFAG
jgi:hypothetical protein